MDDLPALMKYTSTAEQMDLTAVLVLLREVFLRKFFPCFCRLASIILLCVNVK